jgi:copper chaperone CopZ
MSSKTFRVPGISCEHCVMTIQRELGLLDGVTNVIADHVEKMVTVSWDEPPASWDTISATLVKLDFPPEPE